MEWNMDEIEWMGCENKAENSPFIVKLLEAE